VSSPVRRGEQVEGRQAVGELLLARRRRVRELLVSVEDEELVRLASQAGVAVKRVEPAELARIALTDSPQGVLALADPLQPATLRDLLDPSPAFVVVLDGVTDPRNLGAVMRSALAAGATGVVLSRHRAAGLTPAALKAAAGASEYLRVAEVGSVAGALRSLAQLGLWTVGLDPGASQALWGLEIATEPLALVLGSEGRGLSPLVRRRCELAARIPLMGPIGSLNVSAAAAVACFEVARLRGGGPR
jgi:23S rRNA (guanosine2251-2'-O)-methyltransferase